MSPDKFDFKQLSDQLRTGDRKQKLTALKTLVKSGSKEAGKILVSALKQEQEPEIQSQIRKGIHHLKKHVVGNHQSSSQISRESQNSFDGWIVSGDTSLEKKALQHVFRSRDPEELIRLNQAALQSARPSFQKGCIKLMERWLPENIASQSLPFLCLEQPDVLETTVQLLQFSRADQQIAAREDWIQNLDDLALKTLLKNLKTDIAQGMPAELKSMVAEEVRRRERPDLESKVSIDPDLLPRTRDAAQEDQLARRKEKQQQMTRITVLRNRLDQAQKESEIISILSELGELKDAGSNESIIQKLAVSSSSNVIATGLTALAQSKSDSAIASIQPWFAHSDPQVRMSAVDAVNTILQDQPKPMLEPLLKDSSPKVLAAVIRGLYHDKPTQCFLPLSALANSPDLSTNRAALQTIDSIGEDSLLIMVQKLLLKDSMQKEAKQVLEAWKGEPEAAGALLKDPKADMTACLKEIAEKKQQALNATADENNTSQGESAEPKKSTLIGGFISRFRKKT